MDTNKRLFWILIGLAGASALLYIGAFRLGDLLRHVVAFEIIALLLLVLSLTAAFAARRTTVFDRRLLIVVIGAAAVFRLIFVSSPPTLSDDIYRYAWDGKIQMAGLNPYAHTPNEPALRRFWSPGVAQLKDNVKVVASYQPSAQILFAASALAGENSIYVIKAAVALFDLGTVCLILAILRLLKRRDAWVLIYAWSPLAVFEIAGSGHVDGMATFFVVGAVYLALRSFKYAAGALAGLAAATKLYPGIVLAAITTRPRDLKPVAAAGAIVAVVYIPYMVWGISASMVGKTLAGTSVAGGPAFNQGLKAAVVWLCGGPGPGVDNAYAILAACSLFAAVFYYWTQPKTPRGIVRAAFWLTTLLIILLPYTVPWYFALVLPFAVIEGSWAVIYLAGTVLLAYLFYAGPTWGIPAWVQPVEYIPFFTLLLFDLKRLSPRELNLQTPVDDLEVKTS
jgi:alpha-1,6-mannosyltransferase